MFVDSYEQRFISDGTEFQVSNAVKFQKPVGTRGEFTSTVLTHTILKVVNRKFNKPDKLFFFRGV